MVPGGPVGDRVCGEGGADFTWAQTYAVDDVTDASAEEQSHSALSDHVRADFEEASGGHPLAAVWAYMLFLLAYTAVRGHDCRAAPRNWLALDALRLRCPVGHSVGAGSRRLPDSEGVYLMPASPIQAVQEAIESGVRSRAAIAVETGLEPGTVDVILDHLTASGALAMEALGPCPSGDCGSCSAASACAGPSNTRGPVLLKLRRRL